MLSVEKVLGWGLELNLGDGEIKGGFFGEVLDLEAQISLQCFCVVGEILWKYCVVDVETLGGAATGFGVDTLGSFKMGDYCDVIAEEAFDNIKSSLNSDFLVVLSYGGSRVFLLVCFNAAVKYLAVAIIMSVAVAVVMMSLWVNQDTVCPMLTEFVSGIQIWWQRWCPRLGPMYHIGRACG